MIELDSFYKVVSAAGPDSYTSNPEFTFVMVAYGLMCCGGAILILCFILFIYYFIRKTRIEDKDEYIQDFISRFWYRTFLITPKGFFVIFVSVIGIALSFISIELSVISSICFFFLIIFLIIYTYSILLNIFFFFKAFVLKQELINSYINFHTIAAGDAVKKEIQLKAPFPIGFIVKMILFLPPRLGDEIRSSSAVKSKEFINFSAVLPKSKRGEYKIGPVIIEYEDVLGFTKIQLIDPIKNNLKILPSVQRIKKLNWKAPTNKFGDDIVTKRIINTDDFFDLREYTRGDDMKRIHWKISAKADKFMLRVPENTTVSVGNFSIFLDNILPSDTNSGKLYSTTEGVGDILDRMIEIIASIVDFSLKNNAEIELYYFESVNKLKKVKFIGKRRDEMIEKLVNIKWITTSRGYIDSFMAMLNDESSKKGVFYITSENAVSRNTRIIQNVKHKDSVNMIFIEPSSFIRVEKKSLKFLQKIFLLKPYLEQYPNLDNFLTPKKKVISKLNQVEYDKLYNSSRSSVLMLKQNFKSIKVFRKETNFVNELER